MFDPLITAMNCRIHTQAEVTQFNTKLVSMSGLVSEMGSDYAAPLTGSGPPGLNFLFGDSFKRTQRGTMEFSLPAGQIATINDSFKYAFENVFIAKAMHLRTIFTCAGLSNDTNATEANDFFDAKIRTLALENIYRKAVWLWWTVGLVAFILPEAGQPLTWVEIIDPRMVRTITAFGKTSMFILPDKRQVAAAWDQKGTSDPLNKAYWEALPQSWKKQLLAYVTNKVREPNDHILIQLQPGSFIVIENRDMPFNRNTYDFDGSPLQPYFSAAQQYRQLMAGDFAAGFVAKNLIALVSIGDPAKEGANYQRPDQGALKHLQGAFLNPNSAQWSFVDPTVNIRYITPDPATFGSEKYNDVKEQLKNLLPSPFWYNDGKGSFAGATSELTWMQQEIDHCHDAFDRNFWVPIYQRLVESNDRLSKKVPKPPSHHKSNLKDNNQWLQTVSSLYNNGGLSVDQLITEHGFDPEKTKEKLQSQQADVKNRVYSPAFEQKQGIVADTMGLNKPKPGEESTTSPASTKANKGSGKKPTGRPKVTGSPPQSETSKVRTPRPNKPGTK